MTKWEERLKLYDELVSESKKHLVFVSICADPSAVASE